MIHVTPGHEKSISLEIFFKAFRMLPKKTQPHFTLHVRKQELLYFLENYQLHYSFKKNCLQLGSDLIQLEYFQKTSKSFAQEGLESALNALDPTSDILITLPTSKETLSLNGKATNGYTEYLRQKYCRPYLTMGFKNKERIFLLLTDHIPLKDISKTINPNLIKEKINTSLNQIECLFGKPSEVYLSGINPHAGEQGLLGSEEKVFSQISSQIKGPFPGDTLHFYFKNQRQVFIYAFHDQALTLFKGKYGIMGSHITFGLDFLRISVDHGTAFHLYGKNKANPMGCYYILLEALQIHHF